MLNYIQENINPKNKKTGDCVIRAIAKASCLDYWEVLDLLVAKMKKTGYMIDDKKCYEKVLEDLGFIKYKQPKRTIHYLGEGNETRKYLVKEIDELVNLEELEDFGIVISMAHHLTCVKEDGLHDIWNCGNKTIGNYYVKKGDIEYND